ncbi:MAG: hypothetical protein LBJ00_14740 [Planctomycetaceae bacterium]|nr:hypothetical protein [Planctomycetaceae bacterium]
MGIASVLFILYDTSVVYSSCFKIPEAEYASVASRSGCSGAKPTAHTGSGIVEFSVLSVSSGLKFYGISIYV